MITLVSADTTHSESVHFFQNLLTVSPITRDSEVLNIIQPRIGEAENKMLCRLPTMEEVQQALWSILMDRCPGLEDYTASFFKFAWDVVKMDLLDMALEFFKGIPLTTWLGPTNLVLIPNVDNPESFENFAPSVYVQSPTRSYLKYWSSI